MYDEPTVSEIKPRKLATFLKQTFPVEVEIRKNILNLSEKNMSQKIESHIILNLRKPYEKQTFNTNEISVNKKNDADVENITMYDGFKIQNILSEIIHEDEKSLNMFHVIFTDKLLGTYDYSDYRYHGRVLISANPTIISTTGIIEAPAKSVEYHLDMISNLRQGENIESVKQKHKSTYLEYNDKRLSKIIEGYLLQAIFYFETGVAFCDKLECRLFNAHWQKDLIYSQLEINRLCDFHQSVLEKITQI